MSVKEQIDQILIDFLKSVIELTTQRNYRERIEKDEKFREIYKGRELLELLQNADDAYAPSCGKNCKVLVEISEHELIISNNGIPFDKEAVECLCQGKVSPKKGNYIGCKGIGFRSVLNWSDDITIYSGENDGYYSFRFSKQYADQQFEKIKTYSHVQRQLEILQTDSLPIDFPIMAAPEYVEPITKEYDTVIKIALQNGIFEKLKKEVKDFKKNVLLFLPHINEIEFRIQDKEPQNVIFSRKDDPEKNIRTVTRCENGVSDSQDYFLYSHEKKLGFKIGKSDIAKFAVAIPVNKDDRTIHNLYTFFPILKVNSPFYAVMHATFCLTDNRNSLDDDLCDANKKIFKELLDFYVKKVIENFDDERRLELLLPVEYNLAENSPFFNSDIETLNPKDERNRTVLELEQHYIDLCYYKPIFYTVNNQFLCTYNQPIIFDNHIPSVFKTPLFAKIVKLCDSESLRSFALRILCSNDKDKSTRTKKTVQYLKKIIDDNSSGWTTEVRISVFKWWNTRCSISEEFHVVPKLLRVHNKESESFFIENKTDPCFLSGSITELPSWAKISVVDEEDEKQLLTAFEREILITAKKDANGKREDSKRTLSRLVHGEFVNLQEQSSRSVMISPINNSIGMNYDYAVEFVNWLWPIWNESKFDETIKKIVFNLPAKGNVVCAANTLFLGDDYGNPLGKEFFKSTDNYHELAQLLEDEDISVWRKRDFFCDLGVHQYPSVKTVTINNIEDISQVYCDNSEYNRYLKALVKKYPIPDPVKFYNISVRSVENIDDLLKKTDYKNILKWLLASPDLYKGVIEKSEPQTSYIKYKPKIPGRIKTENYLPSIGKNFHSFLHFIFSNTPWFPIGDKMYILNKLTITNDEVLKKFFPCLTERCIDEISAEIECDRSDLKKLLIGIGAHESILDLPSDQFYDVLLKLPTISGTERTSRAIYRAIIENFREDTPKYKRFYEKSEKQAEFFEKGLVLAKNKAGDCSYQPVSNVFFSSSAVLNLNNSYFIDVPAKSGKKDRFKEVFNITPYQLKYKVIGDPEISDCNKDFKQDYDDFLPYLMTYKLGKKDDISCIDISLVKSISIEYDGRPMEIKEKYTLLSKQSSAKKSWLIYVGSETDYTKLKKEKIAEALEQIFNIALQFPAKDFLDKISLLFIYSKSQRKARIVSEFGSSYEYEQAKGEIRTSETLRDLVKKKFKKDGLLTGEIAATISTIDWFSSEPMVERIIDLLKSVKKDIDYLNAFMPQSYSVYQYNIQSLKKEYSINKDVLELRIYNTLKNIVPKHCDLRNIWRFLEDNTEHYSSDSCNSVYFNARETLNKLFSETLEKYELTETGPIATSVDPSLLSLYKNNLESLKQTNDEELVSLFTNDPKLDSLLFFSDKDAITTAFDELKEKHKQEDTSNNSTESDISEMLNATTVDNKLAKGTPKVNKGKKRGTTATGKQRQERKNTYQGAMAEYLVVLKLMQKGIEEVISIVGNDYDVKWRSGSVKKIKKIPTDTYEYDVSHTDDNLGYDIEVVSKSKPVTLYLEVKSSSSEGCSFLMSSNEYANAKTLDDNKSGSFYRVIFVTGLEVKKPVIQFIKEPVYKEDLFKPIPLEYNIVYTADEESSEDSDVAEAENLT